jgi:hypothetical protein
MTFENQLKENLKLYKKHFSKKWINKLMKDYDKHITDNYDIINKGWFVNKDMKLGYYGGRNDNYINPEVSDYFNRLLYGSNIFAIDFILKNKKDFKNLLFVDFGSGFGLLSTFLKHINIECYNDENFSQLGNFEKDVNINPFYKLYNIIPPSSKESPKVDVLYTADITENANDRYFQKKPKYLMMEHWYTEDNSPDQKKKFKNYSAFKEWNSIKKYYSVVADYGPMMRVYKRIKDIKGVSK